MLGFREISLRLKQTLIIMLTSSIVLFLACAAFITFDTITFRRELSERVTILADAIGNNCAAAIDFKDLKAAEETLAGLHADDTIVSSCVYSRDGRVFAAYQRDAGLPFVPPVMRDAGQEFRSNELHVFRPIKQQDQLIGTIFVASDLKHLSARLMRYLGIGGLVLLASLLVALPLSSRLQRLVSDPILQLAQVSRSVALDKNYSMRASKQGNDELGQLVDGFNEMLAQIQARDIALQTARDNLEMRVEERTRELASTHKQLVEVSRRSGMAEVATNVLHNVGNVLNSVNISTALLSEKIKNSRIEDLNKASALMEEHSSDLAAFLTGDAKGRQLPLFLNRLGVHLERERLSQIRELESLTHNVEHIKEIVAMQQSYAKVSGVKETVSVKELVEDAFRMNEGAFDRHGVQVVREYGEVPKITTEKHKVLQILVNLMRNAKYALDDGGGEEKRLRFVIGKNGGDFVKISIIDNGVGIPAENLTRIFGHGFTTRKTGHGFGLHSGALAARELGGSLTAASDGPATGATFTLELPCHTGEHADE